MHHEIGLLLPRSVLYPSIGLDLLEGVRAGLAAHDVQPDSIQTESIGLGGDDNLIYAHCERMLVRGIKVIAGYVNPSTVYRLQPLFAAANALFLALDSGYHFPPAKKLDNIVFLSLQGALCCRMAAYAAVRAAHESFLFATSFYDAGYRSAYAMARAVHAEGGAFLYNHVTPLRRADFSLQPLLPFFEHTPRPAVLASFCGDMAADFFEHLRQAAIKPRALYVSPFMAEETWLPRFAYPGIDFTASVPWSRTLTNKVNLELTAQLKGRVPNVFSMLGYEAGMVAAFIMQLNQHGEAAATALINQKFDSPRGTLRFDAGTHQTLAPAYAVAIGRDEEGIACRLLEIIEDADETSRQWKLLQQDIAEMNGVANNWVNTYPCIDS